MSSTCITSSPPRLKSFAKRTDDEENPIQDFVRLHMMSILHPFADHVRELQGQIAALADRNAKLDSDVDDQKTKLHHHEAKLQGLFSKTSEASQDIKDLKRDLETVHVETSKLRSAHSDTDSTLNQAQARLDVTSSAVQNLDGGLQDAKKIIDGLVAQSADLAKRLGENVEPRLDNIHSFYREVHDRQFETEKSLQQNQASAAGVSQRLEALSRSYSQQRLDDKSKFESFLKHVDGLESMIDDSAKKLDDHAAEIKLSFSQIETVEEAVSQLVKPEYVQAHIKDLRLSIDDLEQRTQKTEEALTDIVFDAAADKRGLQNLIQKVDEKLDKAKSDILHLEESRQLHSKSIQEVSARSAEMESKQVKMREHMQTLEVDFCCLKDWRRGADETIVKHAGKLDQARTGITQLNTALDFSSTSVKSLRADCAAAHEAISTMTIRLDTCYKYFQGLGKGLQDTHRHVLAGEGGMLPPKSDFGMSLPMLPKTPRPGPPMSPRKRVPLLEPP